MKDSERMVWEHTICAVFVPYYRVAQKGHTVISSQLYQRQNRIQCWTRMKYVQNVYRVLDKIIAALFPYHLYLGSYCNTTYYDNVSTCIKFRHFSVHEC